MERMDNNVSISREENTSHTLEDINNEKIKENIGGIIFVSLLMIVGFVGNSIAICVYLRKYRPSIHRTFILSLAIIDLLTCCVAMPFILLTLIYPVMFQNDGGCKWLKFLSYAMCMGSSLILLPIAGERYRKICVPHGKQLSLRTSKCICIICILVGIFLSWPVALMYGNRTFPTGVGQINGTECNVNDAFADTKYPAYYNIFLTCVFFATLIGLSLIYALIGKQIFRMQNIMSRRKENTCTKDSEIKRSRTVAITRVMFIITVVYIFSYLPHLALLIAAFLNKSLLPNLSFAGMLAYQTFRWTMFINNMANPIIYGLYDRKFMQEVCKLWRSLLATLLKQDSRRDNDSV